MTHITPIMITYSSLIKKFLHTINNCDRFGFDSQLQLSTFFLLSSETEHKIFCYWLATLLEGVGLAFDIR